MCLEISFAAVFCKIQNNFSVSYFLDKACLHMGDKTKSESENSLVSEVMEFLFSIACTNSL